MRKSKLKRTMSMLLTVLMVFMSMNFSVFAEELTAPAGETTNSVEAPAEQSADEPAPAVVAPTPVDEETGTTEENAVIQETPVMMALDNSVYLAPSTPALDETTGKECFFANGTPITISKRDDDTAGAKVSWVADAANNIDAGSINVTATTNVFGGGHNHKGIYESTSITMTGGTVNAVFGGGLHKSHVATTNVVIQDGAVIGQIAGGAASSFVKDNDTPEWPVAGNENAFVDTANVTISGGTISSDGLIFGGGEGFSQTGNVNLNITGGTIEKAYITPGGSNGTTTGTATVNISTNIKSSIVQGVNRGTTKEAVINILSGAKVAELYAGGETRDGNVTGIVNKTTVNIEPGSTVADLQPGKSGGTEIAPNSTGLITLNYDEAAVINEGENTLDKLEARFGAAVLGKTAKPIAVTDADGKLLGGYDDIHTAVAEAPTGSVIKLQQDITTEQTIQYGNKALTFDGDGQKYKITSSAERIFILNGTGESGTALTLKHLKVTGNGKNQRGVHVGGLSDSTNDNLYKAQITLDNTIMDFEFSAEMRGINFGDGQHQGSAVILTNGSKILNGLNQEYEDDWGSTDTRGIALWNPKDVTVQIEGNSEIKGFKYAVNVSGTQQTVGDKLLADAKGLNITVDHSTIYGWAAFNIWASYGTYNIQNGSVLKGINTVEGAPGSANAFTTIKLNYDWPNENQKPVYQTYGNVLNITDSTITNGKTGSFDQYLLTIDNAETIESVTLKGARFVDVTGTIESAINIYDDGNKSGSVSKAIAAVKAKTTIDSTSTSVYLSEEGAEKPLPFYDIAAVNGDKEYQNIQDAVDDAAENDTITIKEGTHYLYHSLKINKPVTVQGEEGKAVTLTREESWQPEKADDGSQASLINIDKDTKDVTLKNLTVQGAKDIEGARGHGINVYCSTNVILENITLKDNQAYGLVVNGSEVKASGLYTSGNGWGGVNVDQGSGVANDTRFTLTGEYRLGETYQIKSDKYNSSDNIFVEVPEAFVQENTPDNAVYWNDASTMITIKGRSGNYPTIEEALKAANRGNVILIPAGTYNEDLDFIRLAGLTLQKKDGVTGECTLNGNITIKKKDITFNGINAGQNAKVAVSKDASLKLIDAAGFDTDKKITVEKLFGTKYDTNMVIGLTEDQLGFTYLGEKIEPDGNALTNALGITDANAVTYTVKTPAQFYWLSQQINEGKINTSNVTIKLGNDLDFHNDEWMPVGVANHDYIGKFDGQSHKISNLLVNMPGKKYIGLFGKAWGAKELGNVDFENVNIIGGQYAGTLAGQLGSSTVKNVNVNNFVFKTGKFTGGIVGSGYSNISNCKVQSGSITTEDQNVGGILGFLGEGNFTIQNCHSDQITISEPSWDAGGLIGATVYGNVKVYNCSVKNSTITITASGWFESYGSYRGELIGEMRGSKTYEANLYLYNCNSVDTTAINKNVPGDQSQLVGGNQDYIKTLTVYNENNKTPYATISEAVKEANSGDTITIGAGTYDETVTLDKAVNLVGPNKDVNPNAAGDQSATREEEAVITGGINITRTTKDANGISIKGLKFTKSGIYSVGWGNDPNLDSITIENNVFENIENQLNNKEKNVSAIHFNLADSQPVQNCTIKNNRISGVANGDSSGINVFVVSGETEITGNYIENTNHSALQIPGTAKGNVTITGNTFKNWDQDIANGGRAMRFGDFSGVESLTVTGNKMVRDSSLAAGKHKEQMVAFIKVPDASKTLDLSLNYWNGKLPVTTYGTAAEDTVIWAEEGTAKINAVPYYTDEAMTTIRVPATVYDGATVKGQYLTIQEAVNAAKAGETVQLTDGVYTETVTLNDQVTLKGADSGNTVIQCTIEPKTSPDGNGENAAVLLMQNNITAKVENVAFDITKTGQSPISFNTTGSLTIEGCRFTGREGAEYGTNAIYGGGNKDATVIFKDNTFEVPYRMAITSLGKDSVVTGNTFNIGTDRVGKDQRTSVLTVVAQEGTINISNNIFAGANRAIGVDHSSLSADKLTIKNNQFIDVRYGFELGSEKNKTCGTYDLSKNYYAKTNAESAETVSAMLVEDADKSGSHFDDSSLYTGNQVKVYPYYIDREMTKIYAPVEVQHKGTATASEYFGTIADAYAAETTLEGDTIIVSQNADGTPVTITEDIDMGLKNVNLELVGDTTFNGSFAGSTRANLVVQNGSAITFTKAEKEAIQYYTTVDVKNFDATNPTTIVAPAASTSQNSFIAKGGLMAFSTDGTTNTWIYSSPSDRFNGGDGTAEKPWQINTPEQMKLLQTPAFETNGKFFKLTNDITVDNWTALASFAGNFDGNGYTITGNNVNFIDELAEGAKVEKLRFEGFSNLVNTNNGTVENCWTVGGQTTSIVNIMGKTGKLTDSFTAGAMAVQTNEARGAVLRVYHCGETGGIGTAMTKADMQKARFANSLNGEKEGVWGYSTADGDSAYPFVIKDGGKTTIQPITVTVTPDKTNADPAGYAELLTQGKIYANDEVKVQATLKDSEHYVFSSWTVNDVTADARTAVATIKVKDANTVIKANFTDKPKVMLNVTPVGAGAVYLSINDGAEQKLTTSTYVQEVYIGSKVTVRAEGYNIPNVFTTVFRYWIDANTGQNLSSDSSYTINSIGTPRVLQAVFEEKEQDSYKVQFNDINGKELTSGYYKTTDTINVPAAPIVFGYEFVQWKGDDGSVIDKDTKTITGIKADTAYRAIYRTVSVKYTIKVTDGTIDGKTSAEAEQRTNVTAVANKAPDGKVFVGWQEVVDGVPTGIYLSYSESYTFSVTRNMTIQAIYENSKPIETVRVMLDPTPIITKTSEAPEVYKASFLLELNVPEGYTVVETGFVYKTGEVQNIDELEINKENVIKKAAPFVPKAQFSMGVKNLEKPFVITARAYAILDNGTIMYSDNTAEAKLQ